MDYLIKVIRKHEQKTSIWSGGVTTELAIYPSDAEYTERNFLWRISTARVDAESSLFTHLTGIRRYIMILDGEMTLEHETHHSVHLKPYEQDSFNGWWITRSKGKATDLNLMVSEGCTGTMRTIPLEKGQSYETTGTRLLSNCENVSEAFYCTEGQLIVNWGEWESQLVNEGDLVLISRKKASKKRDFRCLNQGETTVHLIKITVFY